MPEVRPHVEGFTLAEGLWRVLGGPDPMEDFQAFAASRGLTEGADPMALALGSEGWRLRPARVRGEDLDRLSGPALLELKAGGWALLQGRARRGFRACYRVLTPAGAVAVPRRVFQEAVAGPGLAKVPVLGPGPLGQALVRLASAPRSALLQFALAALLLQVLALAGPLSTGLVLDRALPDGADSMLNLVAAGLLLVALFQAWLGWFRGRLLAFLVNRLEGAVTWGFLDHLLRLPFPALQATTLGERLQAVEGLSAARTFLLKRALGSLLDGATAGVQLAGMAWLLPGAAAGVVLTTLVIGALALASGWVQARLQAEAVRAQAREQGLRVELLSGIQTLKAAGAEPLAHRRWRRALAGVLELGLRQGRLRLGTQAGAACLGQGMASGLLIWGGGRVLAGDLGLGTLFAFLQLSTAFMAASLGVVDTALAMLLLRPQVAMARRILALAPEARALDVPRAMGPGLPEAMGPDVPEATGPGVPKAMGPVVPRAMGPDVPEAMGPDVPEAMGPDVPEAVGPVIPRAMGPDVPEAMAPDLPEAMGPIVMDDVWFRYGPERPWVLSGFNLRVAPGDTHFLRGGSGAGKTTILRLLAGLYPPERGSVTLGGVPPGQARPALLYLPQATLILEGTVMDNLRLISGGAPRAALVRAARRSGLEALAATLPMGYDTPLLPGGATLSGGQRQLIALTAALASGRRLLLLDEAMASLDPAASARLSRVLAAGPWTVIAASHRSGSGPGATDDPAIMGGCG